LVQQFVIEVTRNFVSISSRNNHSFRLQERESLPVRTQVLNPADALRQPDLQAEIRTKATSRSLQLAVPPAGPERFRCVEGGVHVVMASLGTASRRKTKKEKNPIRGLA